MSLNDIYGGDFLKAADIEQNWPITVTIKNTEIVKYDDGKQQICLNFHELPKRLGLNKTNATRIAEQVGNEDWEHGWENQRIALILEYVEFQGKTMKAIRVQMPQLQPPGPTPADQYREQQAPQQPLQPPQQVPGSFEEAMDNSGYGNDNTA